MARARSLSEFQKAFSDEASCVAFLFKRRWPDGFVCPGCGKRRAKTATGMRQDGAPPAQGVRRDQPVKPA
jgi:hypothetical protein